MTDSRVLVAAYGAALLAIGLVIVRIAAQSPHRADILVAAILGFAGGILFDRLLLRPAVDWSMRRARK